MPQPGVIVSSPTVLVLFENGTRTSTFTMSLETEPLSDVRLSFSSSSVSTSPSAITFDYTNYNTPITVTAIAIDNFIDEEDWYVDTILTNVTSADSMTQCKSEGRTVCGQAALYSGFTGVPVLNATIKDDDIAGVNVSTTFANATYDNYGDALTTATYKLMLTSQPVSSVVISFSGLGTYSSLSTSSVTIEPENWKQPVSIEVSSSAPTNNRPVCASGNRFCDGLSARSEVVTHSVSSSDSNYDSISVASLAIAVEVVHDASDPPSVTVGRFSNLLNSIVVTFDKATDRASQSGSFTCTNLLNLTTSEVQTLFGSSSFCSFTSTTSLKINFGKGATVLAGQVLSLRDHVLQTSTSGASLFSTNESFVVEQPLSATIPSVSLAVSSSTVGVCDDLTLDGSQSSGSGGRLMTYNFSVVPLTASSKVANVSEWLNIVNSLNSGYGHYRAVVASSRMQLGSSMEITLTATNFLGNTNSKTVVVSKLNIPAPVISIQGADPRYITRSDALVLTATAVSYLSTDLCITL
jgi:hypothetical protein